MAIQLANALGPEIFELTTAKEKIADAKTFGAKDGI